MAPSTPERGGPPIPTVTEVDPIHQTLTALTTGDLVRHGPLTVVPLLAPGAEEPGLLTLAEAGEAVTVTEISEAGAVLFLKVSNGADRSVLLLATCRRWARAPGCFPALGED